MFDEPLSVDGALPLAVGLAEHCGCDHGTKDVSHVWRVPGLQNWPNKKKVDQGRPKEPQPVKVLCPFEGCLVTPNDLSPAGKTKAGSIGTGNGELPHVDIGKLPVSGNCHMLTLASSPCRPGSST